MKVIQLFYLLILISVGKLSSQPFTEKILGQGIGTCMVETPGHNFILTANNVTTQLTIMKIDSAGNQLWIKQFGLTTGTWPNNTANDIIRIDGNRYLVTGRFEPGIGGYNLIYSILIDSSGNTLWERTLGTSNSSGSRSVYDSLSNVVYIAGSAMFSNNDIYIAKINLSTGLIWENYYDFGDHDFPGRMIVRSPNEILMSGGTSSYSPPGFQTFDGFLMSIDSSGITNWVKHYGGYHHDSFENIRMLPDSGLLILGNTISYGAGNNDAWLLRTDKNGDTLWTKTFGFSSAALSCSFSFRNPNSIWICGEVIDTIVYTGRGWLFEIDSSGNLLYSNLFGSNTNEVFYSVLATSENSIYALGESNNNIYLVRLDSVSYYTGLQNKLPAPAFNVYPNPTDGFVTIDLLSESDFIHSEISLVDILFRKIKLYPELNKNKIQVQIPGPSGKYLIEIKNSGRRYIIPVIKN